MECPSCGQTVEPGALFCGNCGNQLQPTVGQLAATPTLATELTAAGVPLYARADLTARLGEKKAIMAVILAVVAWPLALVPLLGIVASAVAVIVATVSRAQHKRKLANVGIIFGVIGVVLALSTWTYTAARVAREAQAIDAASNRSYNVAVTTPCFSAAFSSDFSLSGDNNNCQLQAAGSGLSPENYTVSALTINDLTKESFGTSAKPALEQALRNQLPNYSVSRELLGNFAGSPAYYVYADDAGRQYIAATMVLHQSSHGENAFVISHASGNSTVDLDQIEASWAWL